MFKQRFNLCQVKPRRHWCVFLAVGPTTLPLLLCPENVSASPVQKFLFPYQTQPDKEQVRPAAVAFHSATEAATLWWAALFWGENGKITATSVLHKETENRLWLQWLKAVFCLPPCTCDLYGLNKFRGCMQHTYDFLVNIWFVLCTW